MKGYFNTFFTVLLEKIPVNSWKNFSFKYHSISFFELNFALPLSQFRGQKC